MSNSTHFHRQLLECLRQYSHYCNLRHLNALAWMVSALEEHSNQLVLTTPLAVGRLDGLVVVAGHRSVRQPRIRQLGSWTVGQMALNS